MTSWVNGNDYRTEFELLTPPNTQFRVGGNGLWSKTKKLVNITKVKFKASKDFGNLSRYVSLELYFDKSWNVNKDGLIYTDDQFETDAKTFFKKYFKTDDISYTEQGMQGNSYVSMEGGYDLYHAITRKYPKYFILKVKPHEF